MLTAKNWDQRRNPTLGNRVRATFFTSDDPQLSWAVGLPPAKCGSLASCSREAADMKSKAVSRLRSVSSVYILPSARFAAVDLKFCEREMTNGVLT